MPRLKVCVSSVASILSKIAIAASCSAARTSSQSPAEPAIACIANLRPKLAAKPIAAPAKAAPTRAPVLVFPHEKALCPREPRVLEVRLLLRFEVRFCVRVAMSILRVGVCPSTATAGVAFLDRPQMQAIERTRFPGIPNQSESALNSLAIQ